MSNFEVFLQGIKLSINILFLKSDHCTKLQIVLNSHRYLMPKAKPKYLVEYKKPAPGRVGAQLFFSTSILT